MFANERVERLMRLRTWQAQPKRGSASRNYRAIHQCQVWEGTDEPLLDSAEVASSEALPIVMAPTNSLRGIGAFAARALSEGEFIGEYSGEIVLDDEIEDTDRERSEYLFGLGNGFSVDAQPMGNKTRRMNHASGAKANVSSQVVNHHGVRKVVMRAKCAIEAGAELQFDYMYGADARTCLRWRARLV